jgi:ABC-type branched-subunit amino acid transport system substrate-binding protein
MKSYRHLRLLVILMLLLAGCGPKVLKLPEGETLRSEAANSLFSKSEAHFNQKEYRQAIDGFSLYLSQYPNSPVTDVALMKIATAHRNLGQDSEALMYFQRLLETLPNSPLSVEARLASMAIYYKSEGYPQVFELAKGLLEKPISDGQRIRGCRILADSYLSADRPADAIPYYDQALKLSSGTTYQEILEGLKKAVAKIDRSETELFIDSLPESAVRGYLLFHLGQLDIAAESYGTALASLKSFVEGYPENEWVPEARRLIEGISTRFIFEPNTLGCLLPLSGRYEAYGHQALRGIELALGQFQQAGAKVAVKMMIRDTRSDPQQSMAAFTELADAGVGAVIGPIVMAEQVAPVAQARGIPLLVMTQKEKITDAGSFIFRNFLTPEMQAKALVSYSTQNLGFKRFAVLYPKETYGTTFMNLFWDEVIAQSASVVGVEAYDSRQTDFADPIRKLVGLFYPISNELKGAVPVVLAPSQPIEHKSGEPFLAGAAFSGPVRKIMGVYVDTPKEVSVPMVAHDPAGKKPLIDFEAVFIPDSPKTSGLIIPQLAYYDVQNVYLLGTNIWHSDQLIKMSRPYVDRAIIADGFFMDSQDPAIVSFVKLFKEAYGLAPDMIAAAAYDNAMLLMQIITGSGVRLRSDIRDQLLAMPPYPGVTGKTRFKANGDASKEIFMLGVQDGRFVELERLNPDPVDLPEIPPPAVPMSNPAVPAGQEDKNGGQLP